MTTALYRRYRPDTFDQVIGQEHVTEPLKAALQANRVTHAYLFSGPRGCGKTTSARILARCLNCAQGPTDRPCGQCESCRELATGGPGSLDVVEIDAASHGGVDDARDLRERATFAPVRDRHKIFIIDEAHMVTNQGFNALLKLVEEPPEHVKFVFATTEPERVIGTIRSRTHHYPFRLVPPDVLGPYLTTLCQEERVRVGEGVLPLVMRAGGGSVRDTLSVLDQLMAGAVDGEVPYRTAVALLGYTDSALLDQTVDALAGGDGAAAFRVVERMVESGHDPRRFVEDLLQRLRDLLIIAVAGDGARDVLADAPSDQFERMQRQAQNWGPHGLSRAADLTDEALRAMTGATSPRLQLELLVGRILVPTPAPAQAPVPGTVGMTGGGAPREAHPAPPPEASGRFGAREAREALARKKQERAQELAPAAEATTPTGSAQDVSARGGVPDWSASRPQHQALEDAATQRASQAFAPEPPAGAPARSPEATPSRGPEHPEPSRPDAPISERPSTPAAQTAGGRDADMLRGRWNEVVERLASISRVTWSMVGGNAQLGAVDGSSVVLLFPVEAMVSAFARGSRGADVEKAIREVTGLGVSVSAQVGQASGGPATTGPSAQASHSGGGARPSQPGGWVSEPPPFDQAAAQAAHPDEPAPQPESWPSPARAPEPEPKETAWPEPAMVAPIRHEAPSALSAPPPDPLGARGDAGPPGADAPTAALPKEPARARAKTPAREPGAQEPHGDASRPDAPATLRKRSFTVFWYPGDPEPGDAPAQPGPKAEPASGPVFDDAPIEASANAPVAPTGWGDPLPTGGASVSFDEGAGSPGPFEAGGATATPVVSTPPSSQAPASGQAPAWLASAPQPAQPSAPKRPDGPSKSDRADESPDAPLAGRAAAEAALRDAAQRDEARRETAGDRTHAADDDSASIDDDNIENSQTIGLAAVLEILGGRVIEEKMTEGGY